MSLREHVNLIHSLCSFNVADGLRQLFLTQHQGVACYIQGSYSCTDKKIQHFSRTFHDPHKKFPGFFVAHKCINITYWHHKFENMGLQVICKKSEQENIISI